MIRRLTVTLTALSFASIMFTSSASAQSCLGWEQVQPTGILSHDMAFDSNRGVTVLFGGNHENYTPSDETWEWNGTRWSRKLPQGTPSAWPTGRFAPGMAYDSARGKVVMFGGNLFNHQTQEYMNMNDTWEWDGEAWTRRLPANSPSPRYGHAMAYDSTRQRVVMYGGAISTGGAQAYSAETWDWDGTNWTLRTGTPPEDWPYARAFHSMAYDAARQRMVVAGGDGRTVYVGAETWEWSGLPGASWTFRTDSFPGNARPDQQAMAYDSAHSRVILHAGYDNTSNTFIDQTWSWNGATHTWEALATTGTGLRTNHGMAWDSTRNRMVVFGGAVPDPVSGYMDYGSDTWEWDGTTNPWVKISEGGPINAYQHAMTYDTDRSRLVQFGNTGATWERNDHTWVLAATTGPAGRDYPALAFDASRGVSVFFGGIYNDSVLGPILTDDDTWEWNGSTWSAVATDGPTARAYHALAYDSNRARTVLFGGNCWQEASGCSYGILSDTWEWDGAAWTELNTTSEALRPGGSYSGALAWDGINQETLQFGGFDNSISNWSGATWSWDGTRWLQRSSSGPAPRYGHMMAYDSDRQRVVLFGGQSAGPLLGDTWEWDGASWSQTADEGPDPRASAAMTYDPVIKKTVLMGGYRGTSSLAADTWLYGNVDSDADGIANCSDNCPDIANADQADTDSDNVGDACDCNSADISKWRNHAYLDADADDIRDSSAVQTVSCFGATVPAGYTTHRNGPDNCPLVANAVQSDADTDGFGDACDGDTDGDGTPNDNDCAPADGSAWRNQAYADPDGDGVRSSAEPQTTACFGSAAPAGYTLGENGPDNCPAVSNPDQLNTDGDSAGDACDTDDDNDSVADGDDCAPSNGLAWRNQAYPDPDGDTVRNSDVLQTVACFGTTAPAGSTTNSGAIDNCPGVANPTQIDSDSDGAGDACDGCPTDEHKTLPEKCGCGVAETDSDGDGTPDCNDPTPTVQFSLTSSSGPESTTPAALSVTLSVASIHPVTVDYTMADGTALSGGDYTAGSGTLTIDPGVTTGTIAVPIINDNVVEPDETFTVTVTNPGNATLGATTTHTYTIDNDDNAGAIQLSATAYAAGEAGLAVTITAMRIGDSDGAVGVSYATADGTATAGSDYTDTSGTLTWASGDAASRSFTVVIANDALDESNETFTVTLSAPTGGAVLGSPSSVVVTITDNDSSPIARFSLSASSGAESKSPALISVSLSAPSGQEITVNYATANGTARSGSDYETSSGLLTFAPGETSKAIAVPIIDDIAVESKKTFSVTLTTPVNTTIGAPARHVYSITNDDPYGSLQLSAAAYSTGEAGAPITITATRTGGSRGKVSVRYATANGTAIAGRDYTRAAGLLSWGDGERGDKTFPVVIANDDVLDEYDKTFSVRLSKPTGRAALGSPGSATVTIVDDDPTPTVQFSLAASAAAESITPAMINASLSEPSGRTVTARYATANGTAVSGSDYAARSGILAFAPGQTNMTILVPIVNNTTQEEDEVFTVSLSAPVNATLGAPSVHTYTINDEDLHGAIKLSSVAYAVVEPGSPITLATITALRIGGSSGKVQVKYTTADGTATAGSDYSATSDTLTFDAGVTTRTITVPILHDDRDEANETFTVTLSVADDDPLLEVAPLGSPYKATVTIIDIDPLPAVRFGSTASFVNETASSAEIEVILTVPSEKKVTVKYATANGTATAGSDYGKTSGTLTFVPGVTSLMISVPVIDDTADELAQTFSVTLKTPVNATLGAPARHGCTITDND